MTRRGPRSDRSPRTSAPDPRAGLASCSVLADVDPAVLDRAAAGCRARVLDPHTALFRLGDPGEAMYVVTAGQVVARLASESGELLDLARAGPGALIGYLDVIDGGRRSSDAVAAELGASVVVIPTPVAVTLLGSAPDAVLALARDLAGIVRSALFTVSALAFLPTRQRVAVLLLDGSDVSNGGAGGSGAASELRLESTQELVAQRLGMARQTFSRVLHELATAGVISVEAGGRTVRIIDRPRLRAVAAGGALAPVTQPGR